MPQKIIAEAVVDEDLKEVSGADCIQNGRQNVRISDFEAVGRVLRFVHGAETALPQFTNHVEVERAHDGGVACGRCGRNGGS